MARTAKKKVTASRKKASAAAKTKSRSKAFKEKIKKAQDAGGLSQVAVSHSSKATILKQVRNAT